MTSPYWEVRVTTRQWLLKASMIHSVPNADRVAVPWALTNRWPDWLCRACTAALVRVRLLGGFGSGTGELWMSREWLEEFERRSRKHSDGV